MSLVEIVFAPAPGSEADEAMEFAILEGDEASGTGSDFPGPGNVQHLDLPLIA